MTPDAGQAGDPVTEKLSFDVFWPPHGAEPARSGEQPLLRGALVVQCEGQSNTRPVLRLRVILERPADEAARERWNARLGYPELDWMRYVRVWDREQRWLWPNLPWLLRLPGREREERYGGVDPAKGVDNDFAAVLIRTYDAAGARESESTRHAPLVTAEWRPMGTNQVDKLTIVHQALSEEFAIALGNEDGRAGVWLVYADFMGAKPPPNWPQTPEFAGGILAYFEVNWSRKPGGRRKVEVRPVTPIRGTGFDWERWVARTKAAADPQSTEKLTESPFRKLPAE